MNRWLAGFCSIFSLYFLFDFYSSDALAHEHVKESCSDLLERDSAYSVQTVADDEHQGIRFAVSGGPIDALVKDALSELETHYADRLKTGFTIELITYCRNAPKDQVSTAISNTQKSLRLDVKSPHWGMKPINTGTLLSGTCDAFVLYIQENGIGEMFYNDPVRLTFDAYWSKFDLSEGGYEQISSVESDAQFACSLEPQKKLIEVLDEAATGYQLFRVR